MLPYSLIYKVTKKDKLVGILIRGDGNYIYIEKGMYMRLKDKEFLNAKISLNGRILSRERIPYIDKSELKKITGY